MSDTGTAAAKPPTAGPAPDDSGDGTGWSWMDTAGIIAGAILVVIVADIFTDGRLISRRLRKSRQAAPEPEQAPGE